MAQQLPSAVHTAPPAAGPRHSPASVTLAPHHVISPGELSDEQTAAILSALDQRNHATTSKSAQRGTRQQLCHACRVSMRPCPRLLPKSTPHTEPAAPCDCATPPQASLRRAAARCSQVSLPGALTRQALAPQTLERLDPPTRLATPPLAPATAASIPPISSASTSAASLPTVTFSIPATTRVSPYPSAPPQLPSLPQPGVATASSNTSPLLTTRPSAASKGPLETARAPRLSHQPRACPQQQKTS